jgi:hypothetical protein
MRLTNESARGTPATSTASFDPTLVHRQLLLFGVMAKIIRASKDLV